MGSVCTTQKIHCAVKLYIHIRNSKPISSARRILVTVNKITLPTIIFLRKRKKASILFLYTGLIPHDGFLFFCAFLFQLGHLISMIRDVVLGQFGGPLGNTFPRWKSAAGDITSTQICNQHSLGLQSPSTSPLRCCGRNSSACIPPFLNTVHSLRSVTQECSLPLPHTVWFDDTIQTLPLPHTNKKKSTSFLALLYTFPSQQCVTCKHSKLREDGGK